MVKDTRTIIRDWWNDRCRKVYPKAFGDPEWRHRLLEELAEMLETGSVPDGQADGAVEENPLVTAAMLALRHMRASRPRRPRLEHELEEAIAAARAKLAARGEERVVEVDVSPLAILEVRTLTTAGPCPVHTAIGEEGRYEVRIRRLPDDPEPVEKAEDVWEVCHCRLPGDRCGAPELACVTCSDTGRVRRSEPEKVRRPWAVRSYRGRAALHLICPACEFVLTTSSKQREDGVSACPWAGCQIPWGEPRPLPVEVEEAEGE